MNSIKVVMGMVFVGKKTTILSENILPLFSAWVEVWGKLKAWMDYLFLGEEGF